MALTTEKKVGIFFMAGLTLLAVMLELGERWNPFERNLHYKTYLSSTTGLKLGDPVRLAGVEVGKITKIAISDSRVRVDFEVKPGTTIKTDSVATIRLTNLLGGQFLGLSFGSPTAPVLPPGSEVKGRDIANIDVIVDNVSDLTKDAKSFINDLNANQREVLTKISAMLDENRANLRGAVSNLNSITTKMDRGEGSLAMLLNDKALYRNTNELAASLKTVSTKIERGEGTLGKLVNDDALYRDAKGAVANLNDGSKDIKEIAAKINRGEGSVGKLVNDEALYNELRDASKNIGAVAKKINEGQGTLGKLVNEDTLYRDTTAAMKKVEKAADGLGDSGPISVLGSVIGTLF
ncbi:MlaD family protein [Geobacter sp.]|uniref:MlaD family protein n=1 Tax=Geobacter sp. TaxID=46610 RepID=UPI002628F0CF|nr:MlaD family protein [Geobacter sp.]